MEVMKFSAKTVDDAITDACQHFSVSSDKLEYEVVEEGFSGFLGFNAKPAVINARVKEEEQKPDQKAKDFLADKFGVSRTALRSTKAILDKAEELGITFIGI